LTRIGPAIADRCRVTADIFIRSTNPDHDCCGCERMLIGINFQNVLNSSDDICSLCPVQANSRPAQIETSIIVHDLVSDIVYDISYNDTDIMYDIGIRYRIPNEGLCSGVVLCVYCAFDLPEWPLEGISVDRLWWNRSFQRNRKDLQSQPEVEVFLIDVHPISTLKKL
jgi:hypothetical protein